MLYELFAPTGEFVPSAGKSQGGGWDAEAVATVINEPPTQWASSV